MGPNNKPKMLKVGPKFFTKTLNNPPLSSVSHCSWTPAPPLELPPSHQGVLPPSLKNIVKHLPKPSSFIVITIWSAEHSHVLCGYLCTHRFENRLNIELSRD